MYKLFLDIQNLTSTSRISFFGNTVKSFTLFFDYMILLLTFYSSSSLYATIIIAFLCGTIVKIGKLIKKSGVCSKIWP